MDNPPAAEASALQELYDVRNEAASMGNAAAFDINERLNALRERGPVLKGALRDLLGMEARSPYEVQRDTYTALSFRACERALRENETFTSFAYNEMPGVRGMGTIILNKIGDDHRRFRATAQPMFIKPKAMTWWRPNWIDATVAALLDRIEGGERADLNLDLCAPLPLQVVTRAVGLRGDDALTFRQHLLKSLGNHRAAPEDQRHSQAEVLRMLREVITARRAAPGEDVISGLIAADFETETGAVRKLADDEVLGFCRHLLLAGGGTTWRQLGITIHAMLSHPGVWQACRRERPRIADAVEEAARWNITGPVFPRLVLEETELEGVRIPAGSRMDVCLGAGNRDPSRWDNPDDFDIFRPRQTHLGFGYGPHLCLGQHVARQTMIVAIDGLMERFPDIRLDPDAPAPELTGGLEQRGMSAIPVLLR